MAAQVQRRTFTRSEVQWIHRSTPIHQVAVVGMIHIQNCTMGQRTVAFFVDSD